MNKTGYTALDNLQKTLSACLLGCVFINGFFFCAAMACFCMWMFIASGVFLSISLFFMAWTASGLVFLFIAFKGCVGFSDNGLEGAFSSIKILTRRANILMSCALTQGSSWLALHSYRILDQKRDRKAVDDGTFSIADEGEANVKKGI